MLFHSSEFLIGFLPVTVLVFFVITRQWGDRAGIGWLVAASLVFYAWGTAAHLALIVSSVLLNYLLGIEIRKRRRVGPTRSARAITAIGICLNLAMLGYFKYFNFFAENISAFIGEDYVFTEIILPLAISFFTLQQIAYLVDTYSGIADEHSFLHYALFVTFFPQLIAGPIVHHGEILPQFRRVEAFRFSSEAFSAGLTIFLLGVFKKVVLADSLGAYATPTFSAVALGATPDFYSAWSATLAFSFEIYFDFSAYSDMAIGLARMFSIRLPMNFDSPYRATNIIDFWRRWHITLSRFLRDYVYIPLGGNRRGPVRRFANLSATMLIGGLWHGAAWMFVIWGGLHGLYLIVNHAWRHVWRGRGDRDRPPGLVDRVMGGGLTFVAVTVAWVFFRSADVASAIRMLEGMLGFNGAPLPAQLVELLPFLHWIAMPQTVIPLLGGGTVIGFAVLCGLLALSFIVVFCAPNLHRMSQTARLVLLIPTVGFVLHKVGFGSGASEFIYFRF